MRKVFSICWLYRLNYGGVETRAKHIANGLAELGNDLEMLYARTLFTRKEAGNYFRERGLLIASNPYRSRRRPKHVWEDLFIRKASRYLSRHAQAGRVVEGQGIGAAAGVLSGLPTIATVHGARPWVENPKELETMILRKADLLIAISNATRDRLIRSGVEPGRVSVVHNGVAFDTIRSTPPIPPAALQSKYRLDPEKQIVLSAHNFAEKKNVMRTLSAFDHLSKTHGDCQMVCVGDGLLRREAMHFAAKEGIRHVSFTGRLSQEEVYGFYRTARLFLLPSTEGESWGNAFMEALAAGCPVITSSLCGVVEILSHMKNAWVISDPTDQKEINRALVSLYGDEKLRAELSSAGQSLAGRFDWRTQSGKVNDLIRERFGDR